MGWDTPVEIIDELEHAELRILVSRFGFSLTTSDNRLVSAYSTNLAEGVTGNQELGIAVVHDLDRSPIIFPASGKVVWVDAYGEPEFEEIPRTDEIRIRMGSPCHRAVIIVDRVAEEVVSIEWTRDPDAWCF